MFQPQLPDRLTAPCRSQRKAEPTPVLRPRAASPPRGEGRRRARGSPAACRAPRPRRPLLRGDMAPEFEANYRASAKSCLSEGLLLSRAWDRTNCHFCL
jgi:hypothetical protein